MKTENTFMTKASEPEKVDEFMRSLKYPLLEIVEYLRKFILSVDKNIGEDIFFNAPMFFFTGKMKPFKPKEYKRYLVGFNVFKKDCIRLIVLRGATVQDPTGLLDGNYSDGRRLVLFKSLEEVKNKEKEFKKILKQVLKQIDPDGNRSR